jgi:hypothetical protein
LWDEIGKIALNVARSQTSDPPVEKLLELGVNRCGRAIGIGKSG